MPSSCSLSETLPRPAAAAVGSATVTPLGHASARIEIGGFAIVTDPVLGDRCGPRVAGRATLGPRRLIPPALRANELGPVDAVLLSHAHWDHTDQETLAQLPSSAVACVQARNLDLVRRFDDRRALAWGASTEMGGGDRPRIRVTAVPARHWGARVVVDRWRGFGGFLIEALDLPSPFDARRPLAILFAGDTALTDAYRDVRAARGGRGIDLALMPIGAYDPWIHNHCAPEEAWRMAMEDLGAERFVPIHYDTFRLSREPLGEPKERLVAVADKSGALDRVVGRSYGEVVHL